VYFKRRGSEYAVTMISFWKIDQSGELENLSFWLRLINWPIS